ncbi:MAG: hypothetical protein JXR20_02455 [Balneola sp.]
MSIKQAQCQVERHIQKLSLWQGEEGEFRISNNECRMMKSFLKYITSTWFSIASGFVEVTNVVEAWSCPHLN